MLPPQPGRSPILTSVVNSNEYQSGSRVAGGASYLLGWRGYFGFSQAPSVLRDFDSWIHRRLRCYAWKQWKTGKRRFTELRRLGIGKDLAAQTAGSSKRYWHISRSPALNIVLSRAQLLKLGLPLLFEPEPKV